LSCTRVPTLHVCAVLGRGLERDVSVRPWHSCAHCPGMSTTWSIPDSGSCRKDAEGTTQSTSVLPLRDTDGVVGHLIVMRVRLFLAEDRGRECLQNPFSGSAGGLAKRCPSHLAGCQEFIGFAHRVQSRIHEGASAKPVSTDGLAAVRRTAVPLPLHFGHRAQGFFSWGLATSAPRRPRGGRRHRRAPRRSATRRKGKCS